MEHADVLGILKKFIEEQIIDSAGVDVSPDTPLLEWGILNSLSTTRLIGFVHERFAIFIPAERIVGENFRDLNRITRLVLECEKDAGQVPAGQEVSSDGRR